MHSFSMWAVTHLISLANPLHFIQIIIWQRLPCNYDAIVCRKKAFALAFHDRYGSTVHYSDVIMSAMASQTTGVSILYTTVCSGVDQRKHQSSVSLAFVMGIHRSPANSPHKGPVTRKMLPFDDVIMLIANLPTVFVEWVIIVFDDDFLV